MSGRDPTLAGVRTRLRGGATPAREIAEALARIDAWNDPALCLHRDDPRVRAAVPVDPALPLAGVAVAVKDNLDVAGMPTSAGCPSYAYRPEADTPAVARLRAAGAVPIAKTNLDQFATGLVGTRSPHGTPRNPFDPARIPGGSSSGSACAVAAGIVPVALGTDTAGSGRVPAALTNIVGLKPTRGLVSTRGVVPAVRSLDCVSVFSLTVEDAATVLRAIAGFDAADPFARQASDADLPDGPLRIGVPAPAQLAEADPRWRAAHAMAVAELQALGHRVVTIDLAPFLAAADLLYEGPWVAERTAAVGAHCATAPDADPTVRAIVAGGARFDAIAAWRGVHELARLARLAEAQWTAMDVLALPTVPCHPTLAEVAADPIGVNRRLGRFTNFANLLDTCALALPTTLTDGLPAGVTLFAPAWRDAGLCRLGARLQTRLALPLGATGWPCPPCQTLPPTTAPVVAVFGAHLSGQPLNHRLVALGGRLLGDCTTAATYRCWLLDGAPPRPGLERVASGGGAIAGELWTLPPAGLARLVAEVGAPLALGPVVLDDGRSVPGYVLAGAPPAGARDITASGGWRAWLAAR